MDPARFTIKEMRAVSRSGLGEVSSYMQTVSPCPGESFMGTPVISCASAGLNREQGLISALGDCGCTLPAPEDAGVGVAALVLALFGEDPLQETARKENMNAAQQKAFFINGLRNESQIVMNRLPDLLCFPACVA
jgi:hypothetical protein